MNDTVSIQDLKIDCIIGINPEERIKKQTIYVCIDMETTFSMASQDEDITKTIDYFEVSQRVQQLTVNGKFLLIETLAESIANDLIQYTGDKLSCLRIKIKKPEALMDTAIAEVCIERHNSQLTHVKTKQQVIGIINLSPESRVTEAYRNQDQVLERAGKLANEGAAWIEVGARSTNPIEGASAVSDAEELERLKKPLANLLAAGYYVGVDTWSLATALAAIDMGAQMINYTDPNIPNELLQKAALKKVKLVVVYKPKENKISSVESNHQMLLDYYKNVLAKSKDYPGVELIADPNIGIFKSEIDVYTKISYQINMLAAISKLSSLGLQTYLYSPRKDALSSTIIMAQLIMDSGVDFIRIHEPSIIKKLSEIKR